MVYLKQLKQHLIFTWNAPDLDLCTWTWYDLVSKVFACLLSLELDNYVVIFTPRSRLLVAQIPAQINVVQSSRRCTGNFFNIDTDQVLIPEICLSLSKTDVSNWIFGKNLPTREACWPAPGRRSSICPVFKMILTGIFCQNAYFNTKLCRNVELANA